jgi:pimeloyl-ACP methyl ester carboxylesterase
LPFADLNHRLEYVWLGLERDAKSPIVMLHHGFGSVSAWGEFTNTLAERTGSAVLVYSRWGCGRSEPLKAASRPVDFMSREAREDLHLLLRALDIRAPILLGHSDGASIALLYASAGLEPKPAGLILMAPHVFVENETIAGAEAARAAFEKGALREKLSRYHEDPDGAFFAWNKTWLSPGFRYWNIESELRNVSCPVTVVQGRDDEYGTSRQINALVSGLGTAPEVVLIPDCGHMIYRDKENELLEATARHVKANHEN